MLRFGFLAITCGLTLMLVGCDSYVSYSVENNTDQDLTAWVLFADCDEVVGDRDDYAYERDVPAFTNVEESDITGSLPGSPWCVQVVDRNRRLVRAEPYDGDSGSGPTIVLNEPLIVGREIPPKTDLPHKSFADTFGEQPPFYLFLYALALWAMPQVMLFGVLRQWSAIAIVAMVFATAFTLAGLAFRRSSKRNRTL